MKKFLILASAVGVILCFTGCGRFANKANETAGDRVIVISPIYNEIIWALGHKIKLSASICRARIRPR